MGTDFSLNCTSMSSNNNYGSLRSGSISNSLIQNKADDNSMMEVILKSTIGDGKTNGKANGHYGSNSSISSAAGGLPGLRGRTRQSISGC